VRFFGIEDDIVSCFDGNTRCKQEREEYVIQESGEWRVVELRCCGASCNCAWGGDGGLSHSI